MPWFSVPSPLEEETAGCQAEVPRSISGAGARLWDIGQHLPAVLQAESFDSSHTYADLKFFPVGITP